MKPSGENLKLHYELWVPASFYRNGSSACASRVSWIVDKNSLWTAAYIAARCRWCVVADRASCYSSLSGCRPCWIYLADECIWQIRSAVRPFPAHALDSFQLQAWQKLTRSASLRCRRDVGSGGAVHTHTNAYTNTDTLRSRTSSLRHSGHSLPFVAPVAIDQSAWLPLFVSLLPWKLCAIALDRARTGTSSNAQFSIEASLDCRIVANSFEPTQTSILFLISILYLVEY